MNLDIQQLIKIDGIALSANISLAIALDGPLALEGLRRELSFILATSDFDTPEDVLLSCSRYILIIAQTCISVQSKLTRPDSSAASHTLNLARPDCIFTQDVNPWGSVDIVHENTKQGLYRLNISPHASIPAHYHAIMDEVELVLTDGLEMQEGVAAVKGEARRWPLRHVHQYLNKTQCVQRVLCIDRPCFIPTDEVLVPTHATQIILPDPLVF